MLAYAVMLHMLTLLWCIFAVICLAGTGVCITKDVACKANNMLSVVDAVVRVAVVNV